MSGVVDVPSFLAAAELELEDLADCSADELKALFEELGVASVKLKLQVKKAMKTGVVPAATAVAVAPAAAAAAVTPHPTKQPEPAAPQTAGASELRLPAGADFWSFLTHNWAEDEEGRSNHDRVAKVFKSLQASGLKNWFDEEQMQGNIVKQMTDGINRSAVTVVFVTKLYVEKAGGDGPRGEGDNCFLEFDYASRTKKAANMVVVVMERCCLDTSSWLGAVGMHLGGRLYIDASSDEPAKFEQACEQIRVEIINVATGAAVVATTVSLEGRRLGKHEETVAEVPAVVIAKVAAVAPVVMAEASAVSDAVDDYVCIADNGVGIRSLASESGSRSHGPSFHEVVEVVEVTSNEGHRYLHLADGRGFVPLELGGEALFRKIEPGPEPEPQLEHEPEPVRYEVIVSNGVGIRAAPDESSPRSFGPEHGNIVEVSAVVDGTDDNNMRYLQLSDGRGYCPFTKDGALFFRRSDQAGNGGGSYRCVERAGVGIRSEPDESSSRSYGPEHNDVVEASAIVDGSNSMRYLQLADRRGFVPLRKPGSDRHAMFERVE